MSSIKSIWIIAIVLSILLFAFFVYPRMETLIAVSPAFLLIFKALIFIAILSFTVYLLFELRAWQKLAENLESEQTPPPAATADEQNGLKGQGIQMQTDPDQNYENLTRQILELAHTSMVAQTAFLYLYNPSEGRLTLQGQKSTTAALLAESFPAGGEYFGLEHPLAQPTIFDTSRVDPQRLLYYESAPQVGTLLLIPIYLSQKQFIGFMGLDSIEEKAWGEDDLELARSFALLYSTAIWQIDAIDRQKSHIHFYRDLCKTNTDLSLGIDHLDLYKAIVSLSRKFFNFDKLTLAFLRENDTEELVIEYIEGYEADYPIGSAINFDAGIWGRLMKDGRIVNCCDYEKDEIEYRFQPNDLDTSPFSSCIGVPFEIGVKRFGGLLLESFDADTYCAEDLETLELFGKNLSAIINRITIFKSMKDLALVDGLTGIANHRSFKERFQVEIDRSRRYGNSLTLLILDLDKFKRINDTYGHLFGDLVLKKIANIIRGSVRTVDTVCRYGGEEFAVILINAEKRASFKTADRIRKNVQSFIFEKDDIVERMTISIGMAEYPVDGEDMPTIIANADMAMYQSKRDGGNEVILYEPELES